jgi:hypothetical protein
VLARATSERLQVKQPFIVENLPWRGRGAGGRAWCCAPHGPRRPGRRAGRTWSTRYREIVATEKKPRVWIETLGAEPIVSPAFAKIIASDADLWRDTVCDLGLKPQ